MYLRNGFIIQSDGSYGDTANRHGLMQTADMIKYHLHLPQNRDYNLVSYIEATEILRLWENPQRSPWGNENAGEFSRDQAIPNLCAQKLIGGSYKLSQFEQQAKGEWSRFFVPRLPNGDLTTPQVFNLIREKPTTIGLLELLLNSLICSVKVRINSDDSDQTLNTYAMFATLMTLNPESKLLKLNRLVFKYIHPSVKSALHSYFRPEMGGNIECAAEWDAIVDYYNK